MQPDVVWEKTINEDNTTPIHDQVLSDIDRADVCERLGRIEHTLEQHGAALNQLGDMLTYMVQTVGAIAEQFKGKSPAQLLKGLFSNGG